MVDDRSLPWIKVMSHDSKLLDDNNIPISVDETAHLKNVENWKGKNIKGHIDHDIDKTYDINILDAKWVSDKGLYVLVNPIDDSILEGLKNGTLVPSPEVIYLKGENQGDGLPNYIPFGLGLMHEGTPMDSSAGPVAPTVFSVYSAKGGKTKMTGQTDVNTESNGTGQGGANNPPPNTEQQAPAPAAQPAGAPPAGAPATPPKPETQETPDSNDPYKGLTGEQVAVIVKSQEQEKFRTRLTAMKDETVKNAAIETELVQTYKADIPDDLWRDDMTLQEAKMLASISKSVKSTIVSHIPSITGQRREGEDVPKEERYPTEEEIQAIIKSTKDKFIYSNTPSQTSN